MSTALAIAGITAVLRNLLNDGLINNNVAGTLGSTVTVSVMPPDRAIANGGAETSHLNLFLHQVSPNSGWRNAELPSRDVSGRNRLSNPPLALNLHYLLSAYSAADLHGEILLGYGAQLLHETPVLTREAVRTGLNSEPSVGVNLPPALRAIASSGLADQVELIKITPEYLNTEEMSRIWSATQSSYRPTAAYQVSVVLIESTQPTRSPLPVLSRGPVDPITERDHGVFVEPHLVPPVPTIDSVAPTDGQPVVRLGVTNAFTGHHLSGNTRTVTFRHQRLGIEQTLPAVAGNADDRLEFNIPVARTADFPVGIYEVFASMVRPGETDPRHTNHLSFILAPDITNVPMNVTRDGANTASFSLDIRPEIRIGQQVVAILGQQHIIPQIFSPPTASLAFVIPDAPVGDHVVRIRIDGVDSPIINHGSSPPEFFNNRINIT